MTTPFRVMDNKGFHLTFPNGWTISVQFGPGNYADMPGGRDQAYDNPKKKQIWEADSAEIALWSTDREMINLGDDTVAGWVSVTTVGQIIGYLASCECPEAEHIKGMVVRRKE